MATLHTLLRDDFLDVAAPAFTRLRIAAHGYAQTANRDQRKEEKAFLRLCIAAHAFTELLKGWEDFGLGVHDIAPDYCSRYQQLMEASLDAYRVDPRGLSREQRARLIERLKAAALAA